MAHPIPSTESNLISPADAQVLRGLAGQVAELAARPIEQDKRRLWYQHNALQATRPLVFCDPENAWHEIIPEAGLACQTNLGRTWEFRLQKEIFWGTELQDDRVILPFFDVPYVFVEHAWGLSDNRIGGHHGGAYTWDAPLKDYATVDEIPLPSIDIDHDLTAQHVDIANEIFGDLLTVRLNMKWWWTLGMTQTLAYLRGLEQLMLDMLDQPEGLHRLMGRLRDGHLARLDFLSENALLSLNNDGSYVGSGGFGWTDELPAADFDGRVRTQDMWGFAESQETVGISPQMFEEFIFPYQLPILERFGLNCYGCCEPLDKRWPIVKRFPRLQRVSVSPWANRAFMAEQLGRDYIYSLKPSPMLLADSVFDEAQVQAELRRDLRLSRHCRVEVIMKDTHTICHDPGRVVRWVQLAHAEAKRL